MLSRHAGHGRRTAHVMEAESLRRYTCCIALKYTEEWWYTTWTTSTRITLLRPPSISAPQEYRRGDLMKFPCKVKMILFTTCESKCLNSSYHAHNWLSPARVSSMLYHSTLEDLRSPTSHCCLSENPSYALFASVSFPLYVKLVSPSIIILSKSVSLS